MYSYRRTGEDADRMIGAEDETNFFMIDTSSGTTSNHFPLDGEAGCLIVFNLYNTHIIQIFVTNNLRRFIRGMIGIMTGGEWTAWKEL